ncbi:hypothetical protein CBR_g19058 [Chara braunii]|uniref:Hook C-terminal domain-containing protein n=1 Tax=Chara braunii TaxID=69332 RepID=A0A388KX44_CHABU|nr:hypothetical protein CBR_g19058 [Chara braunii]|eukprot:GBG74650.1 hypothetical protein CBR_g19058 [Chara braunii]
MIADLRLRAEEVPRLKCEIRNLKDQLDVQAARASTAEASERLVDQYKKKLEKAGSYRKDVKELEEQNQVLLDKICELEGTVEKLEEVEAQLEHYQSEAERLDARVKELITEAATSRLEAARARSERDEALEDVAKAKNEVSSLRAKVAKLQLEILSTKEKAEELEKEGASQKSEAEQWKEKCERLEEEIQKLRTERAEVNPESALRKKIEEVETEREHMQEKLKSANERAIEAERLLSKRLSRMHARDMRSSEGPEGLQILLRQGVGAPGPCRQGEGSEGEGDSRDDGAGNPGDCFAVMPKGRRGCPCSVDCKLCSEKERTVVEDGRESNGVEGRGCSDGGDFGDAEERTVVEDSRELVLSSDIWLEDTTEYQELKETRICLKKAEKEYRIYKAMLEEAGKSPGLTGGQGQLIDEVGQAANRIMDAEIEQTRVKLQEKVLRAEIRIEQYKAQFQEARVEALGLRQQLEVIRAQLGNCRLQIDTMHSVLADAHRDKETVIAELKQKAGEVENMKGLLEGKARDLEAANQKVDMVAEEGKRWEEKIRKAEQELAQLKGAVEEKQDREQELLKELDRVKKEAADRLSEVNDLLREKEKWGERVLNAELTRAAVERELAETKAAAEASRVEVDRLKQDLIMTADKVKRKGDKLAEELASRVTTKEERERDVRMAEARVRDAEYRAKEAEKKLWEVEGNADRRVGNEDLNRKELERRVLDLERQRDDLKACVGQHEERVSCLQAQVDELKQQIRNVDKARMENKEMAMKEQRMITAAFYDLNLEFQREKHKTAGRAFGVCSGNAMVGLSSPRSCLALSGLAGGGSLGNGGISMSSSFTASAAAGSLLPTANSTGQLMPRQLSAKMNHSRPLYATRAMENGILCDRVMDRTRFPSQQNGILSTPVLPMGK